MRDQKRARNRILFLVNYVLASWHDVNAEFYQDKLVRVFMLELLIRFHLKLHAKANSFEPKKMFNHRMSFIDKNQLIIHKIEKWTNMRNSKLHFNSLILNWSNKIIIPKIFPIKISFETIFHSRKFIFFAIMLTSLFLIHNLICDKFFSRRREMWILINCKSAWEIQKF